MRSVLVVFALGATVGWFAPASAQGWRVTENGLHEAMAVTGADTHSLAIVCDNSSIKVSANFRGPVVAKLPPETELSLLVGFDGEPEMALPAKFSVHTIAEFTIASLEMSGLNARMVANRIGRAKKSVVLAATKAPGAENPPMIDPTVIALTKDTGESIGYVLKSCEIPDIAWPGPALGIALEDFQSSKRKDAADAEVVCTGSDKAVLDKDGTAIDLSGEAGQTKCIWARPVGDKWEVAPLAIASQPVNPVFTFKALVPDLPAMLVRVFIIDDPKAYATMRKALIRLYREPTDRDHDEPSRKPDGSVERGAEDRWYFGPYRFSLSEDFLGYGVLTFAYDDRRADARPE